MKEYNCEKCGKLFIHKHNYLHHINRKNTCNPFSSEKNDTPTIKIDISESPTYKIYNQNLVFPNCVYCNEIFSSNSARNRHMEQSCKLRERYKELITMYDKEIENLEAENKFLKKTYSNLFGEKYLFPFGLEKFRRIEHKHIQNIIKEPISGMLQFIQDYHFNPKRIQFHNIRIINDNYIEVYNGKRWEIEDIDMIIQQLLKLYRDTIEFTVDKINLPAEEYVCFSGNLESLFININEDSSKYKRLVHELKFIIETKLKNLSI
jgi:uncharacterized C2H2 Zn-finger protein